MLRWALTGLFLSFLLCHWSIICSCIGSMLFKNTLILFFQYVLISRRARSLILAPPQAYSSHHLHHRAGNARSSPPLQEIIYRHLCVPSWFWSWPSYQERHTQEEEVKPTQDNLHRVSAQLLVSRSFIFHVIISVSAYWKPTMVTQTLEVLFPLSQAQMLGGHTWSRRFLLLVLPPLICGSWPQVAKWLVHLQAPTRLMRRKGQFEHMPSLLSTDGKLPREMQPLGISLRVTA